MEAFERKHLLEAFGLVPRRLRSPRASDLNALPVPYHGSGAPRKFQRFHILGLQQSMTGFRNVLQMFK